MANTRSNFTVNATKAALNLSEGTRQALEMYGYATSPVTGDMLVGTGVADARVVSESEYWTAVKAHKEKLNEKKESTLL